MNDTEQTPVNKGGRPRLAAPPTISAEVRILMAQELVKTAPDRFKVQGLTTLLETFEKQESKASANAVNDELSAATEKIAELEAIASKVGPLEQELTALKTGQDNWRAEQVRLLTADAMKTLSLAAREKRQAADRLQEAEQKFSSSGLEALLDAMRALVIVHKIPAPDVWSLPLNTSPFYLALWDEWPIRKATLFLALHKGWPEDSPSFRDAAYRIFVAALPTAPGQTSADNVSDLHIRVECFTALARKFDCLDVIQHQVDAVAAQRFGEFQRNHLTSLQSQELEMSRHGAGRVPLGVTDQPTSPSGYTGECVDPANCCCPKHNGLPPHLRTDVYLGTKHAAQVEDMNAIRPMTGDEL